MINIVGFVGAIGKDVPRGAQYLYNVNFFGGFMVAGGCYWVLCRLFPVEATSEVWCEVGDDIPDSFAYSNDNNLDRDSGYDVERMGGKSVSKGGIMETTAGKTDLDD